MGWEREKTNICSKSSTTLGYHMYSVRKGGGMRTESTTWHKTHNSEREGGGESYNPARSLTKFVWNLCFLGCVNQQSCFSST